MEDKCKNKLICIAHLLSFVLHEDEKFLKICHSYISVDKPKKCKSAGNPRGSDTHKTQQQRGATRKAAQPVFKLNTKLG